MLLAVFGTVGAVASFSLRAVECLAEAVQGTHYLIKSNSSTEFANAWEARKSDDVILFSDSPDATLTELILQSKVPFSVFVEPGDSIINSTWEAAGVDLWPARVRILSLAALHDLIVSSSAMVVRSDTRLRLEQLLTQLAVHYRLPATEEQIKQAAIKLGVNKREKGGPIVSVPSLPVPADKASCVDARWRERLAPLFANFAPLMECRRVDHLGWPSELFLAMGKNNTPEPLTTPVELTGPARTFIWGPYLNLPSGRWQAQITMTCARNPSGCRMAGDIYSDVVHAAWSFMLPEEGTYAFDIGFEVTEPRKAVEIRFFLREGMIDGSFNLRGVNFIRLT